MSLDTSLAFAGLTVGLFGIGITVLWPTKKMFGVGAIVLGFVPLVVFAVLELRGRDSGVTNEKRLAGFSANALIRIPNNFGSGRHYIFDFGHERDDRLSVYISADRMLVMSLIDAKGEGKSISIPIGGEDVPIDKFIYLATELGLERQATLMRIIVNGQVLQSAEIPIRIDFGALDVPNGTVGADIKGANGARFDMSELGISSSMLSKKDIAQYLCYFKTNIPPSYIAFSGDQWMRVKESGAKDLQSEPNHGPIFRTMTGPDKADWLTDRPCER